MIFEQIRIGGDRNFAYLIGDEQSGEAAVVDASYDTDDVLARLARHSLTLKYIISTHDHYDHTDGNARMRKATGAQIAMHASAHTHDVPLHDGDVLKVGDVEITILHTPGHTDDCICLLFDNKVLTGDTLFVGKVGGTGFGDDARAEYDSLHNKLMTLDDAIEVYPGHDYGSQPSSTIGHERTTNPFIIQESFDAFVDLKRNWRQYKRDHNIQ